MQSRQEAGIRCFKVNQNRGRQQSIETGYLTHPTIGHGRAGVWRVFSQKYQRFFSNNNTDKTTVIIIIIANKSSTISVQNKIMINNMQQLYLVIQFPNKFQMSLGIFKKHNSISLLRHQQTER